MKVIFYLTFNGVLNNTNGIGTQTKTLLEGFDLFYDEFKIKYGDISLNIITPNYNEKYPGYSKKDFEFSKDKIKKLGGDIFFCNDSDKVENFWTIRNWNNLSEEASEIIKREAVKYDEILIICVDIPFLHTPIFFEKKYGNIDNIKWLLSLYSSSYIHDKGSINNDRLAWEYIGISNSRFNKNVYLAKVCNFMENHLIEYYGAPKDKFIPYESSLFLQSNDFNKLNEKDIEDILLKFDIPLNKDIIFCFGRGTWIKGFDVLFESLPLVKNDFHLVFISVPLQSELSENEKYIQLFEKAKYSYTMIPTFSRILPKALCQWYRTKIVVCPSRGEPFSNIPLEISLWAKDNGPVMLASDIDGFLEQIIDGYNGYLFRVGSSSDLTEKINYIFSLENSFLSEIKEHAYEKVTKERDFFKNIKNTLNYFWGNNDH